MGREMAVFLIILKIIGIILLAILGLILALLLFLLFVPVRYRVMGVLKEEGRTVSARVHWLLHIISGCYEYKDGEHTFCLRIFGIRFNPLKAVAEENDAETESKESDAAAEKISQKESDAAEEAAKKEAEGITEEVSQKESGSTSEKADKPQENQPIEIEEESKASPIAKAVQKVQNFFTGIREKCRHIGSILCHLPEKIKNIYGILTDEANKNTLAFIWKELLYLFKHFKFRKIHAALDFSMGDPALTGQVLGAIAVLPVIYRQDIHICPDFAADEGYVRGDFWINGRIRMVHLLCSVVRLLKEKDVRTAIAHFRK
jgi:hypothetical protein